MSEWLMTLKNLTLSMAQVHNDTGEQTVGKHGTIESSKEKLFPQDFFLKLHFEHASI